MGNLFPLLHAGRTDDDTVASLPVKQSGLSRAAMQLAGELPYLHEGTVSGFGPLHLLSDDTLGFAFSMDVPVVDTVPDAEQSVADTIAAMLHAIVPGVQWQWFFHASNMVEASLEKYLYQPGHDAAGALFCDSLVHRWRNAQIDGFFPNEPEHDFHPRSQKITVALKSAPLGLGRTHAFDFLKKTVPEALARIRRKPQPPIPAAAVERMDAFVAVARNVLAAAHAHHWSTTAIDAEGLIDWVGSLLFPQRLDVRGASPAVHNGGPLRNEIRTAIASMGRIDAIDGRGFQSLSLGLERHHRVVSLLWQPRSVHPGMLNRLALVRPNINLSITASLQGTAQALLALKARALLNARSTHRFNETEMQARAEALQEVEQRIFADGERIAELRLQVHLAENSADEADMAADLVCKQLQTLEIEAAVENDIGSTLLLRGCLPFAVYPQTESKLHRRRRMLTRDCAELHPAGGCWTGTPPEPGASLSAYPRPIVLYSNSLGEPLFIDPTQADKNPHALVVGQSGSGKSFFVHDYLLHLWRLPDVRLFLISIKPDYRKLALILGRNVEVSLDCNLSLNPFAGAPTRENQARWFAALELMICEGQSSRTLTREMEVTLQSAALAAAQRNWNGDAGRPLRETLLEHVCDELERNFSVLGRQLASQLHPYRRGPYQRLFNAPRGITPTDRFVFFNLGSILRQPCAALASFCIFGLIDETMNDPSIRAVPKGLIADEVWALVRNSNAAAILERSLKAYRSLGGFAMPIVQDPKDLDSAGGRVMLVNTATKIILPMDRSGHEDLGKYVRLNDREMEIVRNLRLAKRRYSEFYISIEGIRSAKGMLIPDPLRYAISTTDPVDEQIIDGYFQKSNDMLSAVKEFAARMPYGVQRN